jgi:serine/threonine-protein kinase RsbW
MSQAAREDGSLANTASLRVSSGPLAGPVLTRLVSMVLARANCPIDRLDDAMLVCDTVSAHAPAHASDGRLAFTVATDAHGLELRVGGLAEQGARRLVQDAALPGVGNVLERVVDELGFEPGHDSPAEELVLQMCFQASRA